MTSYYRSLIKLLLITAAISTGIAFSAFSISKSSQPTAQSSTAIKSPLQGKIAKEINMLTPGHKHFNRRFVQKVLNAKNAKQEAA